MIVLDTNVLKLRLANEGSMKKVNRKPANDMRPEYDFASMKGGVRGKYVKQYRSGTNLILLDPELAEAFPTDNVVNEVLRAVLQMTKTVRAPQTSRPGHTKRAARLRPSR